MFFVKFLINKQRNILFANILILLNIDIFGVESAESVKKRIVEREEENSKCIENIDEFNREMGILIKKIASDFEGSIVSNHGRDINEKIFDGEMVNKHYETNPRIDMNKKNFEDEFEHRNSESDTEMDEFLELEKESEREKHENQKTCQKNGTSSFILHYEDLSKGNTCLKNQNEPVNPVYNPVDLKPTPKESQNANFSDICEVKTRSYPTCSFALFETISEVSSDTDDSH